MLNADQAFEAAQRHVSQTYPAGFRANLKTEIRDPPGFYFCAEYSGESCEEHTLIGPGGFFVNRVTGEIRDVHSGEVGLASAAVWNETASRDVAATIEYLLKYSDEELHRRAGDQKLPRNLGWTSK